MLTRRGLGVLAASLALAVVGKVLGLREMYGLCGAGLGIVVAGFVTTRGGSGVRVTRTITPSRVHVDGAWRVEMHAVNTSRTRRSPVLAISTTFSAGQRYARFALAPLVPGASATAAFRLPTDRRGVFTLGPLVVERSDIFSLVTKREEAAPATKLTVYPRVDDVSAPSGVGVTDPLAEVHGPRRVTASGGDFYALTEYEQGDDLRRVHWPSVARTGRLMIRQEETPWRGRTTVVLDLRARAHTAESFEDALSAAASVLLGGGAGNGLVRLVTTGPFDSGFGAGRVFLDHLLEVLALAQPQEDAATSAFAALSVVSRRGRHSADAAREGPCIITTSRGARELGAFMSRDSHAVGVVFVIDGERATTGARRGASVITVPVGGRGFASAWQMLNAPRRGASAAR
ncbi:MAG TPA: DUF58 domain-containing protein [Acidimicrobiales bacterium]|nr:DUF58 domain-containing protein [Acidimicrobiales bacterium]